MRHADDSLSEISHAWDGLVGGHLTDEQCRDADRFVCSQIDDEHDRALIRMQLGLIPSPPPKAQNRTSRNAGVSGRSTKQTTRGAA